MPERNREITRERSGVGGPDCENYPDATLRDASIGGRLRYSPSMRRESPRRIRDTVYNRNITASLTSALGLSLGEAEVAVHGVKCQRPVLVQ